MKKRRSRRRDREAAREWLVESFMPEIVSLYQRGGVSDGIVLVIDRREHGAWRTFVPEDQVPDDAEYALLVWHPSGIPALAAFLASGGLHENIFETRRLPGCIRVACFAAGGVAFTSVPSGPPVSTLN